MSFIKIITLVYVASVSSLAFVITPVHADSAIWPRNKVCKGYATETGSGYSGGALLLDPIPAKMNIAALNPHQLNFGGVRASLAGAWLEVTGPVGKVNVYVTDLYHEGGDCALDMSYGAFEKISGIPPGRINISWKLIPGPYKGPVQYRIKEGSSINWAAIQVRRTKYPVMSLEYYKNGRWVKTIKTDYNHFILTGIEKGNIRIRYRDIYNHLLNDYIPTKLLEKSRSKVVFTDGHVQFPT